LIHLSSSNSASETSRAGAGREEKAPFPRRRADFQPADRDGLHLLTIRRRVRAQRDLAQFSLHAEGEGGHTGAEVFKTQAASGNEQPANPPRGCGSGGGETCAAEAGAGKARCTVAS